MIIYISPRTTNLEVEKKLNLAYICHYIRWYGDSQALISWLSEVASSYLTSTSPAMLFN